VLSGRVVKLTTHLHLVSSVLHLSSWHTFLSVSLPAHSGRRPLIQFRNHFSQTVGLLGRVISPSQDLYLNTGQHKHRINGYTHQTCMPRVRFEPTIPASEREKTVNALDGAVAVTGTWHILPILITVHELLCPTKCSCNHCPANSII
jgi:hypothetical protein